MKNAFTIGLMLAIAFGFIALLFIFLPVGVAIAIVGAGIAAAQRNMTNPTELKIAGVVSYMYFVGVLYSFYAHGWLWGLAALVLGFFMYRMGKSPVKNDYRN